MPDEQTNEEYLYARSVPNSSSYIQSSFDVALDENRPPGLTESTRRIEYTDRYQELSTLKDDHYVGFWDFLMLG